jgi:hypothetical protein
VEESIPALTDAVEHLRSFEKLLASPDDLAGEGNAGLRSELQELRRELDSAARLVETGAALQHGWARLLGAALGYTASGDAAPLAATGRIWVTG